MYQVSRADSADKGKEKNAITLEWEHDEITLNGQPFNWDIATVKENYFHIIKDNKSYTAEIINVDRNTREVFLKINGIKFNLVVKDKLDLLLDDLGFSQNDSQKVVAIKAPMPGLILGIQVEEGQQIIKGDAVMVLEAMKMENVIKSPGDGVIKSIKVDVGESVEKNQVLIEF